MHTVLMFQKFQNTLLQSRTAVLLNKVGTWYLSIKYRYCPWMDTPKIIRWERCLVSRKVKTIYLATYFVTTQYILSTQQPNSMHWSLRYIWYFWYFSIMVLAMHWVLCDCSIIRVTVVFGVSQPQLKSRNFATVI